MPRSRSVLWTRRIGDFGWWTFVVAALVDGGVAWPGSSPRGSIDESYIRFGAETFTPFTSGHAYVDASFTGSDGSWWLDPGAYAVLGFIVTIAATMVQAFFTHAWASGVTGVAATVVALFLFMTATPGAFGVTLRPVLSMVIVLAAIVVREVGIRLAPRTMPA